MALPKIAFFFGAGAEVPLGMPSGGQFALDIFRRDFKEAKKIFARQRDRLIDSEYNDWLPDNFRNSNIYEFGKLERSKIFEETLSVNRTAIANMLGDFDKHASEVLIQLNGSKSDLEKHFHKLVGTPFGQNRYGKQIQYKQQLGSTALFDSAFFCAAIDMCRLNQPDDGLIQLVRSAIKLLSGALGQDLVSALNQTLFENHTTQPDVFNVGELFRIDSREAGEAAFVAVLDDHPRKLSNNYDAVDAFKTLLHGVLERVIQLNLSYEALMDEYYPYLFKPHEWAKFSRISVFLHGVHAYVKEAQTNATTVSPAAQSYYNDLAAASSGHRLAVSGVATSNYTNFASSALTDLNVHYLNGNLNDFLDPYRNNIVHADNVDNSNRFLVPLLFTQSGTKPMTSINMAQRYVDYYNTLCRSDWIVVVGFGFNGDDGHINGLIRHAVDVDMKHLIVLSYEDQMAEDLLAEHYRKKIRIERSGAIWVLPVDNKRLCSTRPWIDAVLSVIMQHPVQ